MQGPKPYDWTKMSVGDTGPRNEIASTEDCYRLAREKALYAHMQVIN
jgi:hypothetical protein